MHACRLGAGALDVLHMGAVAGKRRLDPAGEPHLPALVNCAGRSFDRSRFEERQVPSSLEPLDDGGHLPTSSQTRLRVDKGGAGKGRAYCESPSRSGWAKLGAGLLSADVNPATGSADERAMPPGRGVTRWHDMAQAIA